MAIPNEHHDKITAGLRIVAERPNADGTFSPVDVPEATSPGGTISILAKDRDGNAVLVTNAHFITGLEHHNPTGGERVYHHEISGSRHIATVPQWDILRPAWVERIERLDNPNRLDVCYAVLESGVDVKFALHGHDGLHLPGETINAHTYRRIIPGTHDPTVGDKLFFLGRNSGEHEVTVIDTNSTEQVGGLGFSFGFEGLITVSTTTDLIGGDSGAGLYKKVGDTYQLSCIFFANYKRDFRIDPRKGQAFRASEAATALDLTFYNTDPVADAGPPQEVRPLTTVTLHGSASNDPDTTDTAMGRTLTYLWEQVPTDGAATVNIRNNDRAEAEFESLSDPAEFEFKLTVKDAFGGVGVAKTRVTVRNRPPVANAGYNQVVAAGSRVELTGASISDEDPEDRGRVTPLWSQKSGTRVTLEGTGLNGKYFTAPLTPGDLIFELKATDPYGLVHIDEVRVRVSEYAVLPTNVSATAAARSVDIRWDELSIATGYEVEIGISPSEGGLNHTFHDSIGTSITIPNLMPQKTYEYRVRMTNDDGVGPWTAWARVATPGETPPVPTPGQWFVRYRNNRIQVKMKELPATTPAIDQVKAKLGISPLGTGLGSDTITVTRDIGTRLNRWVNVLTDADAEWQMGMWTAQVRFENTVGDPRYSAGKTVVVTPPNNPPAANAGYHQVARTNTRVNLTDASASDPDGADQEGLTYSWIRRSGPFVLLNNANSLSPWFMTPRTTSTLKFRLRVTDPQGARDSDDVTIRVFAGATSSWYDTREEDGCGPTKRKRQTRLFKGKIEKQWVSTPEEIIWTAWADTDETRNEDIGDWTNTGRTRENPVTIIVENEQTRTITWEKEQERTNQCDNTETQWVDASEVETRWVPYSSLETTEWEDVDPAVYEGCGPNRRKQQTRIYLGNREYQYVADPEELVCSGPWTDVVPAETQNRVEGAWTATGSMRETPEGTVDREESRTITYDKKQRCTDQCGGVIYNWLRVSTTETRWVPDTPEDPPTEPPTNIRVTTKTHSSVTIAWNAVPSATGYTVELGIPPSAGGLGHTSTDTMGTSTTISNLTPLRTYEYRVQARNDGGPGPWSNWATVVTKGQRPPKPTSDQWNFRYSSNKLQAKVISLPTVTPVITKVELTMETGQPPNLNTVTKNIGTSLDTWVDVLTSSQTGWTTGTWIAQIRFRNSVDYGPYSDVKSDTVPTPPTTTPDPDPCTWRSTTETRKGTPTTWTHVRYSGCGPDRRKLETRDQPWEKKEECVLNGVVQDTRWVYHTTETEYRWLDSPEPYRWRTVNDGSPTTTYTAWSNLGEPYLSGSSCKQEQIRQSTTVQRRKQVNHCNDGVERPADPVRTTTYQRQVITVSETWGDWSYTGGTDYDDIEDVVYYQQERFSSPCNRRETRWVTTRP